MRDVRGKQPSEKTGGRILRRMHHSWVMLLMVVFPGIQISYIPVMVVLPVMSVVPAVISSAVISFAVVATSVVTIFPAPFFRFVKFPFVPVTVVPVVLVFLVAVIADSFKFVAP